MGDAPAPSAEALATDVTLLKAALAATPSLLTQTPWEDSGSILHASAAAGAADAVKLLLDAGASKSLVDEDGQTPLHHAAAGGHLACVVLLTDTTTQQPQRQQQQEQSQQQQQSQQASPSQSQCEELLLSDKYEMTPYHLACESGHDGVVSHLLGLLETRAAQSPSSHARVTQVRRGSALFLAKERGHASIVGLIEQAEAAATT